MEKMTAKDVTQSVKTSVSAYLMARAYAETMRERVDKIESAILVECPLPNDLEQKRGLAARQITDPNHVYLCTNDDYLQDYFQETDKRLREAGYKPDDMSKDHCPALVAEHLQTETEWILLDCASDMMKMGLDGQELNHRLLCKGMDKRQEFIDLVVGLVVNLPDFKNPLVHNDICKSL